MQGVRPCRAAARRVRRCSGNSTGRRSLLSSSRMAWTRSGSSLFSGRWYRSEDVFARLGAQAGGDDEGGCVVRGHLFRGFDDRVASQQDAVVGHASRRRFRTACLVGAQCKSARTPMTRRLSSSGMARSGERRPGLHVHDGAPV